MTHSIHPIASASTAGDSLALTCRLSGTRATLPSEAGEPVPFRKIDFAPAPEAFGGRRYPSLYLPDVTGPFGLDEAANGELPTPSLRRERAVGGDTQLSAAKRGVVTPEMAFAATRENLGLDAVKAALDDLDDSMLSEKLAPFFAGEAWTGEAVRRLVASGEAVIPANVHHREAEPTVIGERFQTKVNANIGTTGKTSDLTKELEKLREALYCGADTVMDLSVGADSGAIRRAMLRHSPVPLGTVPIYEALEKVKKPENLDWPAFRDTMLQQAEEGVDYMTIHAGVLREHVEKTKNRLTGIVSRGGGILAAWMYATGKENFLFEHFDEILDIARRYDVTLSLGDGLRPGSIYDDNDEAQFGEMRTLGELGRLAFERDVQVMIEGPGHVPYPGISANQEGVRKWCGNAPLYTLGPLPTDVGAGYDHISAAIGGTALAACGTAMLCYVTPKEHLGLPEAQDVREGMAAFRIAAHAADIAKGIRGAALRDFMMSAARYEFRWNDQFALTFDPQRAAAFHDKTLSGRGSRDAHFCSMCGPGFCPMKIARDWFKK